MTTPKPPPPDAEELAERLDRLWMEVIRDHQEEFMGWEPIRKDWRERAVEILREVL